PTFAAERDDPDERVAVERTERAAIGRHAEPTLVCRQRKRELFLVARRERGRLLAQALQAERAIGRCIGRREAADFHRDEASGYAGAREAARATVKSRHT